MSLITKPQILLIDDRPVNWFDSDVMDVSRPDLSEVFDIHWLRTPEECREFLEEYTILAAIMPEAIGKIGLPPDILIFDYALTQTDNDYSRKDGAATDVLSKLKTLRSESNIGAAETQKSDPLQHSYQPGGDKFGCFIGGTLARVFADQPCGSIPVTAAASYATSDDVTFFEWFNKRHFDGQFDEKTNIAQNINEIVSNGVAQLRRRIQELADTGIINVDISSLISLSESSFLSSSTVKISSRYGLRSFGLDALFYGVDETDRDHLAKEWADQLLSSIFQGSQKEQFEEALKRALTYVDIVEPHEDMDEVFDVADSWSDISADRTNLIRLVSKKVRSASDMNDIRNIAARMGLDEDVVKDNLGSIRFPEPTVPPIYTGLSPALTRWTILILCVLVECRVQRVDSELRVSDDDIQRRLVMNCIDPLPAKITSDGKIQTNIKRKANLKLTEVYKHDPVTKPEHGVLPSEGRILRALATSHGLDPSNFPTWLKFAPD